MVTVLWRVIDFFVTRGNETGLQPYADSKFASYALLLSKVNNA
jgi:hypothetical protein